MFGSTVLDVLLALAFLYLLLSVVCSGINELLARVLALRHQTLMKGLDHLLMDPTLRDKLLNHPLVRVLGKEPAYIPSKTFALALLDLVAPTVPQTAVGGSTTATTDSETSPPSSGSGAVTEVATGVDAKAASAGSKAATAEAPLDYERLRTALLNLPDCELRTNLLVLADSTDQRIDSVRKEVATWFDSTMSRASDWYKSRTHWILLVLAALLSIAINADTLEVGESLWRNSGMRQAIVAAAGTYVESYKEAGTTPQDAVTSNPQEALGNIRSQMSGLELPLGWKNPPGTTMGWLTKIMGLFLTTLAVSLGAPFWFDVVNEVILVRGSPPEAKTSTDSNGS